MVINMLRAEAETAEFAVALIEARPRNAGFRRASPGRPN